MAKEQRQKAWEIIQELVPKCVAILGPLFDSSVKRKGKKKKKKKKNLERSEKQRTLESQGIMSGFSLL